MELFELTRSRVDVVHCLSVVAYIGVIDNIIRCFMFHTQHSLHHQRSPVWFMEAALLQIAASNAAGVAPSFVLCKWNVGTSSWSCICEEVRYFSLHGGLSFTPVLRFPT